MTESSDIKNKLKLFCQNWPSAINANLYAAKILKTFVSVFVLSHV